nr:SipW-dependent-type signal peptide-containing protein [Clostridia bacterium]
MNKRKILMLALSLCMVAILAVGGTMAYFMDVDSKTNVFTVGNVAIDLTENFDSNNATLVPATGSAQNGTLKNGIEKEVFVTNTGSEEAYVRVHIAIPTLLDDGDPTYNASLNVLHFNYAPESVGEGKWDWSKTTGAAYEGDWNAYKASIGGVDYNVYVVTYEAVLKTGEKTVDAMSQVYLDPKTTNEDVTYYKSVLGDEWKILVAAEGTQADGFTNAYEALNTAFGVPGSYNVDWTTVQGN